mgnify:CR=1 FL=1
MRYFIIILFYLLGNFSFSQDTICIPQNELNSFFIAIDDLEHQDSLKTSLIKDLEYQITNYEMLTKQDSLILGYKQEEITLLNGQIQIYDERLKKVDKWYRKPWVGFIIGSAATIFTIHVIDYTLP